MQNLDKENKFRKKQSRGYSFGRGKCKKLKPSKLPGPGAYNLIKKKISEKPLPRSLVLHKRFKSLHNIDNPGPGAYEPSFNLIFRKFRETLIDTTSKPKNPRNKPIKKMIKLTREVEAIKEKGNLTFEKQSRFPKIEDENDIGPGYYNLKPVIPQPSPWVFSRVMEDELKIHL